MENIKYMVYSNIFGMAREAYEAWRDVSPDNHKHLPAWWALHERTRAMIAFVVSCAGKAKELAVKEPDEDDDVKGLIKRLEDKASGKTAN